ncbi:hypothetical protein CUMW_186920 [Citrus unshiu]|nr:hypothetical protein CUMW_186920 [Citrus unshiu]
MLTIEMQQEGSSSYFSHIYLVKMMLLPTQQKTQQVHVSYIYQVAHKSVIYKECSYKSQSMKLYSQKLEANCKQNFNILTSMYPNPNRKMDTRAIFKYQKSIF